MTKVLHVYGDDYAAEVFEERLEDGYFTMRELWNASRAADKQLEYDNDGQFEYMAYEFGDVDPKFVDFVYSTQDYDNTKSEQFYVIALG